MDDLLERLKRERRWAVAVFVVAAAFIGAVQYALAPQPDRTDIPPTAAAEAAP